MVDEPPLVSVERRDDGVAVMRLQRPKVNALSRSLLDAVAVAARELTTDPPGAVVVTGGPKIFAAGAEIAEFGGPAEAADIGARFLAALNAMAALPRITIAAVSGYALGGGCELALACDLRICSSRARFGQPEILLGIIPGGGATQRLPRLIGSARAKELMWSGRQVGAEEALAIGLVGEIVPDDADVTEVAIDRAATFAAGPLVAQALIKQAVDTGLDRPLADGLVLEQSLFTDVFGSEDAATGVASFLAEGPGHARFRGR